MRVRSKEIEMKVKAEGIVELFYFISILIFHIKRKICQMFIHLYDKNLTSLLIFYDFYSDVGNQG